LAVNAKMGQTARTLCGQQLDRRIAQVAAPLLDVAFSSRGDVASLSLAPVTPSRCAHASLLT
jgi:hypothetical protein